jgi:methylmalonyl-CoA/ethylmalonyl-CoA epimerase
MAVRNIEKALEQLDILGNVSEVYTDYIQKVKIAFVSSVPAIEFMETLDEDSPVNGFLKKGISIYHICYSVNKLDDTINLMRKKGFLLISHPKPAVAFDNKRIAFLFSRDKVMIELVEE